MLYTLSHSTSPLVCWVFWDSISQTICPGWLQTIIHLISASQIARITGVSHQLPAPWLFLNNSTRNYFMKITTLFIILPWVRYFSKFRFLKCFTSQGLEHFGFLDNENYKVSCVTYLLFSFATKGQVWKSTMINFGDIFLNSFQCLLNFIYYFPFFLICNFYVSLFLLGQSRL
jgi:hypothetical protein